MKTHIHERIAKVRSTKELREQLWVLFQLFGGEQCGLGKDVLISDIRPAKD